MDGIWRTKFVFESEVREVNIERLEISVLQGASLNVRRLSHILNYGIYVYHQCGTTMHHVNSAIRHFSFLNNTNYLDPSRMDLDICCCFGRGNHFFTRYKLVC